jgi:hypothetical protein
MMAVIFLATGFLAWSAGRDHMRAEHGRYLEYNELLEPMVEDLSDKGRRMQIIEDHVQPDKAGILAILEAVSDYDAIGPVDEGGRITLSDVKYSMGGLLEVSGMALAADDVSDFVLYLDSLRFDGAKLFSSVNVRNQSTTSLPRRDQTIYSFQVVASLERPDAGRRSR